MQIVHTSDWQVGETSVPKSLSRQESALLEICHYCSCNGIDEILVVGDVFHHHTPTQREKDLLLSILFEFERAGINLRVVPGNHDFEHRTHYSSLNTFHILQKCKSFEKLFVYEAPGVYNIDSKYLLIACSENAFPFEVPQTDLPVVAAFHGLVKGARLDNGVVLSSGAPLQTFLRADIDYVALGDIHLHQVLSNDPPIVYSGALLQHNFGESSSGFVVVDLLKGTCSFNYREIMNVPRLQLIDIDLNDLNKLNEIDPGRVTKIRLHCTLDEKSLLDLEELRERLSNVCADVIFEFKLRPTASRLRRIDKVTLESTLRDDFLSYLDACFVDGLDRDTLLSLFSEIVIEATKNDRI